VVYIDMMRLCRIARRVEGWDIGTFDSLSLQGPSMPMSTRSLDGSHLILQAIDATDAEHITSISSRHQSALKRGLGRLRARHVKDSACEIH